MAKRSHLSRHIDKFVVCFGSCCRLFCCPVAVSQTAQSSLCCGASRRSILSRKKAILDVLGMFKLRNGGVSSVSELVPTRHIGIKAN